MSATPPHAVGHRVQPRLVRAARRLARTPAVSDSSLAAARAALTLTDQRLALMREVMVTKWQTRTPIEDPPRERAVIEQAVALARGHDLAEAGVRRFFALQIAVAKDVELAWGHEWLLHGFPPDVRAPDLTVLRGELSALTPRLVAALAGLGRLQREPARALLLRESRRIVRTPHVTDGERDALVTALLAVTPRHERHPGRSPSAGR